MRTSILLTLVACAALAAPPPAAASGPVGSSEILTPIPADPGYPEGVAVFGTRVYVTGPAAFGTAGAPASRVWVYSALLGQLVDEIPLVGEDLTQEHAAAGIAVDLFGRLYVLSTQLGVVRINPYGATSQEIYAPALPDLPMCAAAPPPCSPTPFDAPPLANDIAFDHLGRAYITDSLQATVWRVPYGGGAPQIWLQDPRFIGELGANGIRLSPDGGSLYIGVTGIPNPGAIYRVPIMASPTPADVELFHQFATPDPDGLAFGRSGRLYVTMAFSNEVAVLLPDGTEEQRFTGPMAGPDGPIAWDNPAVLAFSWFTRRVFIANHALLSGNPDSFNLFALNVGERGALPALPLILP